MFEFKKINSILNKELSYTNEQYEFIMDSSGDSIILNATAGSGKTHSCVGKFHQLLKQGVKPSEIIFFSFTTDAVDELRKRAGSSIKITTIHSFCSSILTKARKYKEVVTFYDFIKWYAKENKPKSKVAIPKFKNIITNMFDNADKLSGDITTYKLAKAANIKMKFPDWGKQYYQFLFEEKKRDFADMLIEVFKMVGTPYWNAEIKGKYNYVFVDEYQDTSLIQMQILIGLNAKEYFLVGDRNQSIYNFSGTNSLAIEKCLKSVKKVQYRSLSINFRSGENIVNNSNNFSTLKAIAHNTEKPGKINRNLLDIDDLPLIFKQHNEVAVLVRTNSVIKQLEYEMLRLKIPLRYFNYITENDMQQIQTGEASGNVRAKFIQLYDIYPNEDDLIAFIRQHSQSRHFITTIHKSKGREYDAVVVVNSISPDILEENNIRHLTKKEFDKVSFIPEDSNDNEAQNIHYVAITRPKQFLYYMLHSSE